MNGLIKKILSKGLIDASSGTVNTKELIKETNMDLDHYLPRAPNKIVMVAEKKEDGRYEYYFLIDRDTFEKGGK